MADDVRTPKSISRRSFIKGGGAAALAGAASVTLPTSAEAAAFPDALPKRWHETFDVVVVGSGFAGLAAAYEAKKAGASVVVFEKMRTPGGNSIINGGIVAAAGSPLQTKLGIKTKDGLNDSPEVMAADMIREGLGLNHPDLVKLMAEESVRTVQWTIDELGVQYDQEKLVQEGGHSAPRSYRTHNSSGSAIVQPQLAKLKALGVEPRTGVMMKRIIRDKDGRVKGLEVREGYSFPQADSGKVKFIKARKAVVLCHGGFARDIAYRMIQDPKLTDKVESTNQPGATAEAWREAARAGCHIVQADWIQVGPWGSPDEKGFGLGPHFAQEAAAMFGIWVNASTGKRFISELANRKLRADAIMNLGNKGQQCVAIADASGVAHLTKGVLEKQLERGVVKSYPSLDAAAKAYGIPVAALEQTVSAYNKSVKQGKDSEFDRYMNQKCKPLETAPFYVMRLMAKVHHCMGGININVKAQALDVTDDKPIKGLYAAGEAAGGVHGAVRLGSCAVTDCLVFGRIAGKAAAAEKPWS